MFKKCMSIALVLVMVFGVLTIMPFPVSATIDSGSSVIVENVSEVSDYYGTPETIDELSTQEAIEDTTTNLKGNDDLSPVGSSFTTDDGFTYTTNGNCATITKYAGTANELVIPDTIDGYTVTEISSNAFYNRSALVSVIIPDSVTNIGSEAFYGCTGLTSVSISKNLVTIETGLFRGCTALKSVVIPNKVTTIKSRAFQGCKGLESVTIPSSVISIGYEAFYNCSGLTKINIPNSVTTMDSEVFFGCSGLTSLTFPNNITSIESALCKGCTGLTSITIPNTATYIGSEAFRGCSSLINLTIPASVTDIISNAFRGCSGLSSISVSSGNPIYDSRNNCNAIIESKSKEIILGCKNTIIPNGIFRIGDAAFYECSGLSSISIPESVTQIGDQAFCGCVELDSISIPDSVDRIGSGSFAGTAWYNNQPNGVVYAGRNLYKFKGSITSNSSLILSQGTKSITDYAFENCTGLASITIPDSLTHIGYCAFLNCTDLTDITISDSVTSIGNSAFANTAWYNAQSEGLVYIGKVAYTYKGIMPTGTELKIKSGTKGVANSAFYLCSGMKSVDIPDSVTNIGDGAFNYCSGLDSIRIPDSVTTIGNGAFSNTGINNLSIGSGVVNIGNYAFHNTDLTSVTITSNVEKIGERAFGYYSGKDSIYHKVQDFVIYGETGSTAEAYAIDNEFAFVNIGQQDTQNPSVSLSSTNNVASSQTVTISLSDNVGIKGYYWGTSSSYSNNSYTSTSNTSITKTVESSGTYYVTAVDTSGNVSSNVSITFYKTTLNANATNATVSPTSVLIKSGNSFTFPTPTRSGYTYNGWSTSSSASSGVKTLSPSSNTTYYAVWSYNDTTKPTVLLSSTNNVASSQTVTISLSDNVGIKGYYWGTSSTYSNNSYTSTSNTSVSKTVDASGTYYATAVDTSGNVSSNVSITFYKTTLNANANNASVSPTSVLIKSGNSFTFPTPTRSGYTYNGWSTSSSASSGVKTLSPSSNTTYYAVWSYNDTTKPIVSLSSTNNVASSQTVTISLSDNVGIKGYYWGTSSTYSSNSYTSTSNTSVSKTVDASGIYYATAVDTSGNVSSNVSITFYKTTLNANGGSVSPTSILTKSGNSFTFPTPTRSNYSYVGWSTSSSSSSGVKTLSPSSNTTYYAVWEPCYTFVWGQDNWNFYNSDEYFGKYYYVDDSIINTFRNQFSVDNTELYTMKQKMNNYNSRYGFQGSCYGMTISEILVKQGDLNLSDYGGNSIVNRNNNSNRKVVSLINAIQLMQNVGDFSQTIRQAPFSRGSFTQYEYISKLEDVLQNSHMFVKIGYSIKDRVNSTGEYIEPGSHAVLAYGIENCNYYSNVTYKTYDRRILICDPNRSGKNTISDDACIYYKSSDHSWIIPYWYGEYYSYNYGKITEMCYWNAGSSLGTKTGSLNNIMKYDTVSESTNLMSEYSTDHYIAGLEIDSDNEASVQEIKETGNPNMEFAGGSGTGVAKFTTEYEQNAIDNNSFDSYALWNPTANYSVSFSKPSKVNTFMDYENTSYYIEASNSNYILFKPSGYMQMNGSESDYSITMVTDSSECVTDWYAVTVTGSDIDKLTYKKEKNGYILSSTSLNNVSIKAENDSITTSRSFTTDYNSVFIYEIDKTHIGIKVDKDNNGTYETELPVDYPEVPDELLLGDVDGDGTIMITDATFIQRKMAQIDIPFDFSNDIADADGDGDVTLMDTTYIQRWLANLKSNDNIGKPIVGG